MLYSETSLWEIKEMCSTWFLGRLSNVENYSWELQVYIVKILIQDEDGMCKI